MSFAEYFPVWDKLDKAQQKMLLDSVTERSAKAGTVLYTGGSDCLGLVVVKSGRLRAYSLSGEGREITLYRLFDSARCLPHPYRTVPGRGALYQRPAGHPPVGCHVADGADHVAEF